MPLGWFEAGADDGLPEQTGSVILIGNAGPQMFRRFARERSPATSQLDDWTRETVDALAADLDARALYPFDVPHHPFLTWARKARAGHVSPLGLNIHPVYGLWHAYRAALLFPVSFDLPLPSPQASPCDTCVEKPCLSGCPVSAFTGQSYEVDTCAHHVGSDNGSECFMNGCLARRACPIGRNFMYEAPQIRFHMDAFLKARQAEKT